MIIATLMDKARARAGIATDMALAERFNRSRAVVSKWRAGKSYPDEDTIIALAKMAGDDPRQWLVAVRAVRADGPAKRYWEEISKALGAVTAIVLCVIGMSGAVPGKAYAVSLSPESSRGEIGAMPIMFKADWGWWASLARQWLAWRLRGSKPTNGSLEACVTA